MKRTARTSLDLVFWLVVGAAITVGVAWAGAAAWSRGWTSPRVTRPVRPVWPIELAPLASGAWPEFPEFATHEQTTLWEAWRGVAMIPGGPRVGELSSASSSQDWENALARERGVGSDRDYGAGVFWSGWPRRSMVWWRAQLSDVPRTGPPPLPVIVGESGEWRIESFGGWTLPTSPVWPAFAENTAIYAAAAWSIVRGPIVLRRTLRTRRGRCLKCAYDRAGLAPEAPCPECGRPGV